MHASHQRTPRRAVPVLLTIVLLSISCGLSVSPDPVLALATNQTLRVYLDAATTITGPNQYTDNPYHTLGTIPNLTAYLANGSTRAFTVDASGALSVLPTVALPSGGDGTFDSCGAWLNSTYQDGAIVRGWYHAETNCNYQGAGHPTQKSVAYVESSDGGRTFTKVGYPNNQVITAPAIYTDPNDASEGDQHVIRVGSYYYMYFLAARDFQVRVARSLVTDGGKPGTWYKYYNGAWSEPGLGGQSSAIASGLLTRSWVSYNTDLGMFVGVSYYATGFGLAVSTDGFTNWRRVTDLVLASPGPYWGRTSTSGELLEYPSFIGTDGDSQAGLSTFWLYYMQLKPGQDFSNGRYLVRRQVHIVPIRSSSLFDTAPRIALTRYQSTTAPDTWVTTTNPDPQFKFVATLGSLFTIKPEPNALPIYDCYLIHENDHMLDILQNCNAPGNPNVTDLRQMGWISTIPFANSVHIYRCFDSATLNHFVSTDPACEGKHTEWAIGYLEAPYAQLTDLQFYPLAKPVRLLDTRVGSSAFVTPNASLTAGQTLSLPGQFTYQGVTIPAAATAIVGNATVANGSNGTPAGFATIFPSGVPLPLTSNLNFVPGTVRPNDFTVALGADGKFNLYSSSGGDFVIDLSGYYAPVGAGGLYFHPLSAPVRELDTRAGASAFVHPNATLTAGQTLPLPGSFTFNGITVPVGAKALVGNATVANNANGTPAGFATLFPDDVPLPLASNLNFVPGTVAPNAFTVALGGGDGGYNLYTSSGGDFVLDITGYLDTVAAGGLLFTPLSAPVRELDTRAGATADVTPGATLTANQTLPLPGSFTFNSIVVPASAQALVGNATVANDGNSTPAGFATLYPGGVPLPLASNLNFVAKQVAPNAVVVGVGGDGSYNLYTSSGGDFVIDISGYFATPGAASVPGKAPATKPTG